MDNIALRAHSFSQTNGLLAALLALNLELAEKEKNGVALTSGQSKTIVGPWAPDKPPKKSSP
ncbi:MAG: hypothetical protein HC860_02050 [Alkalinema sp. RU_4_3]|nr:hypothetical protein [Alkalinema sp. RU_4_3]